jgi:Ca2+-binding RTX toxin-like protein
MAQYSGTAGDDVYHGTAGQDTINGAGGNDTLYGAGGNDTVNGGAGADRLDGGAGNDILDGGDGDDTYVVDSPRDRIFDLGRGGRDTVEASFSYILPRYNLDPYGGASVDWTPALENLTLTGADAINGTGNRVANLIIGNGAANILDGAGGVDKLRGGDGDDVYIVDDIAEQVTETSATGGIDRVESSATFVIGDHIENLTLTGSAAIDGHGNRLGNTLTGNSAANRLNGRGGADAMAGGAGDDVYYIGHAGDQVIELADEGTDTVFSSIGATLGDAVENLRLIGSLAIDGTGNDLANLITGNVAANKLHGMDGSDTLDGGLGADVMTGGAGDDRFVVDHRYDRVVEFAGEGIDEIVSSISIVLGGTIENLTLTGSAALNGAGNALANSLAGNAANNRLDGRAGADRLEGKAGDDLYLVDDAGDQVIETSAAGGYDRVMSSVSFSLAGSHAEVLELTGGSTHATGNGLDNRLIGNRAANVLSGGDGMDILAGGTGKDGFVFDTALGAENVDKMPDFSSADDTIHLSRAVFTEIAEGTLARSAFVYGRAASDADDRILYDQASGKIWYDADGSGAEAAILFAQVRPDTGLGYLDFVAYTPPV